MDSPSLVTASFHWFAALSFHRKVLVFAFTVFIVELAFRWLAPKSKAYARWTAVFKTVGKFWTMVILSIVYFLSVALVSAFMKLSGKDPLDRALKLEPTFWRPHEPNPLGAHAAARHQF